MIYYITLLLTVNVRFFIIFFIDILYCYYLLLFPDCCFVGALHRAVTIAACYLGSSLYFIHPSASKFKTFIRCLCIFTYYYVFRLFRGFYGCY